MREKIRKWATKSRDLPLGCRGGSAVFGKIGTDGFIAADDNFLLCCDLMPINGPTDEVMDARVRSG